MNYYRFKKDSGYISVAYHLRPLTKIHLHSAVRGEISPNSNIRYIYFLSAIAIILLVIAGINFTSLATAQALQRHKEAGIRKVLGAGKGQLIGQFLIEAILLALIAISAGYILIYYTLPFFNTLSGSQFFFAEFFNLSSILFFAGAAIGIGILAGIYPALLLSAFQPVKTLKGLTPSGKKGATIWKSIVVVQFAASITIIICTVTIYQQLQYIQNKDLGFNKDRIITIPNLLGEQYAQMKTRLNAVPGVEDLSISSYIPGVSKTSGTGLVQAPGRPDSLTFDWISVDYNYFDTYGIKLEEGRTFSQEFGTDSTKAFMLNEAAATALGWESPLGKELNSIGGKGKVIGLFAALALFIACLGLFSLSSFTATKKQKEIGIRKVLGATVPNILFSFYKSYSALIVIASLLAIPASYFFLSEWLQQFAFHIDMPMWFFLLAIAATLFIALAAVSYESVKAAIENPVDTLKT